MIDVTGVDLVELTKRAYLLSVPAGLGFLHYTPQPMTDDQAKEIVERFKNDKQCALDLDYVGGRACKLTVLRRGDKLEVHDTWYDHTDEQYAELLEYVLPNIKVESGKKEHGMSCHCVDCGIKRGH